MKSHRSMWGIHGHGSLVEHRFLGVWFYRRITIQKWSPLMHEYECEWGFRIGHRRFGMTETVRKFFDGKEPSVQRKAHP